MIQIWDDRFSAILWNWRPLSLKSWYFEASKDIMTKSKPQALHVIIIKYWKVGGSCNPRIPTLWNKGILLHEQTTHNKHFWPKCTCSCCCKTLKDVRRATFLTPVLLLWMGATEFYLWTARKVNDLGTLICWFHPTFLIKVNNMSM